jgi:CRISPR-associated protein Cas1
VRVEQETKLRLPIHTIGGIVCFGQVSMSPPLMALCGESGVAVSFLSENGRFLARVEGPVSGNVLLRREQYRRADSETASASVARSVLLAKINNSRTVLQRALRDHAEEEQALEASEAVKQLERILRQIGDEPMPLDMLRGLEGEAARYYFGSFDHMVVAQKEDFFFKERSRRPPLDNLNALLSFIYTLLVHDVAAALQGVGLDPAVGYLHRDRPGRPSLALDVMEEFRPFLADRLALTLVNLRQVKGGGFTRTESGGVVMNDRTRKEVLVAWQKRKQEEIEHPFLGERVAVGLLPHCQALLLSRYLRGELEAYPPFLWR